MLHPHIPRENRILDALPVNARSRLLPKMTLLTVPLGMTFHESGDELRYIYFPLDAIVSLLCVMKDGASTEIAMVGHEGAIGLPLCMGDSTTSHRAVVQSAGSVYRLTRQHLRDEFDRDGALLTLLLLYAQTLIAQTVQTAACNRHHTLDQQLCRWLLLSLDRHLASKTLTVTHEFVAQMLGVRREGVTAAAGKLKDLGVIRYARGRITVLDRPTLEKLSCECYSVVRGEADRVNRLTQSTAQQPQRISTGATLTIAQPPARGSRPAESELEGMRASRAAGKIHAAWATPA